ncbi:MAG: DUF5013 domain-containing protein [Bacteroidaceae bacterium]|nr:DUF5013 domain-containing protein [Bacteroidaceae bacterium]
MKTLLFTLASTFLAAAAYAQEPQWDKEKYPDFDPVPHIDAKAQQRMKQRVAERRAQGQTRPDHWNNALMDAFPPVVNQAAGSCGSASRIYYMFTEEMNAARGANGKLAENIYPTHFTWLLTWTPNGQGKEVIAQHNGIPNSEVYGGYTYSDLFGYQDCDSQTGYDYGWMQGYDKWFHAMHNRISGSANFSIPLDREDGRELVKNYLWNHCGDESYATGGIVGVGVASGGNWQKIPKSTVNDQLGVTGKYYVKHWGTAVDHALTIVGYDDRIEFDLDGNGIKGEADKDEVGAWIIVNSWGAGWNNGGFVYCPYAEARPTSTTKGYWTPEYYTIRRDYRPLRTLKVKMDYSRRSEIALFVGYSTKANATKADKEIWLRHFYYSGLCKGFTPSASNPDPEIPMLGRWADGDLHTEPMEFGYDLTDLVAEEDAATPLKYFLRVETRSWAKGEGHIYDASIVDYAIDPEGVETPFEVPEGGKEIANKGRKTTLTTVARGESIPAPRNLAIEGNTLTWQAPARGQYAVETYTVRLNGEPVAEVSGTTLTATIGAAGAYTVTATYNINGHACTSQPSAAAFKAAAASANKYLELADGAQVTIPHFNRDNTNQFAIEFWFKPTTLSATADNFGMKSSSGKFFFKVNKQKRVEVGFDGGDCATSSKSIKTDTWQHIAIAANNGTLNVYVGNDTFLSFSTGWSNTVGGVGDLTLGLTEGTSTLYKQVCDAPWTGAIDELRIWSGVRSKSAITSTMNEEYIFPSLASGLTHYYNMETRQDGGSLYLVDAVAGNDAIISTPAAATQLTATGADTDLAFTAKAATDFVIPSAASVGKAVALQSSSAPGTTQWAWTFTGADIATSTTPNPVVVFTEAGTQTVKLTTTNINGETTEKEKTIAINAVEPPQADFAIGAAEVAAGDHVSFINTSTPLDDCTYVWEMEGADTPMSKTTNVAVTYSTTGTYTVRLTATNAAGSNTVERQVQVVKVAPEPAFAIHNNVALAGEEVTLIDQTKYEPESWQWAITSKQYTYIINGQSSTVSIDQPGVYSVSLTAANEKGSNTTTRNRAIYICASDGQTGLKFDDQDDELVAAAPFGTNKVSAFTIDFWLYPGALAEQCCAIGDSEATFLLRTGLDGTMTMFANNKSLASLSGYVQPNEWHHYAITFSSGTVTFYRDGTSFSTGRITSTSSTPAWQRLRLGGSEAPMNAIIDELRVWKRALSNKLVQQYANAPVSEPQANTDLVLYYDFNQSTGNVEDHSASNNTGMRNNFGPDGDAWSSSKGIFFLNFEEPQDVTKNYLKNYKAPFLTASGFVNGTSRFRRLQTGTERSPWMQENSVVADGITTEFYVDANKDNFLTLATEWDGFADEVHDLKLYQTVELPMGAYEVYAISERMTEFVPMQTKTVVAAGSGLPGWDDLDTEALGASYCGVPCKFTLDEPTTVSIGLVSNQKGKACHTISQFYIYTTGYKILEANGGNAVEDITPDSWTGATLQATGGLGSIHVATTQPQYVSIYTIGGQLAWGAFVEHDATVRVPSGLYVVGGHKVIVK